MSLRPPPGAASSPQTNWVGQQHAQILADCKANENTTAKFADTFKWNLEANAEEVWEDFLPLMRLWKGEPAVLVAYGPSLDKNGHRLRKMPEYVHVATVNRALPWLLQHGVLPEVVFLIDPISQWDVLEDHRERLKKVILVADIEASAEYFRNWPGKRYVVMLAPKGQKHNDEVMRRVFVRSVISSGGSTATVMFHVVRDLFMADPLVLVGHDFGWTGEKYPGGDKRHPLSVDDRMTTMEIPSPWKEGEIIYSRADYHLQRHWMHAQMIHKSHRRYINATEGGLLGAGDNGGWLTIGQIDSTTRKAEQAWPVCEILTLKQAIKEMRRWRPELLSEDIPERPVLLAR